MMPRLLRPLGVIALASFLVTAFTPLVELLQGHLMGEVAPRPADAIVVLGSSVGIDGTLTRDSLQRTVHGILLYKRGLAPLLVLSGTERPEYPSEAEMRARLARDFGVPPEAIVTEGGVQTTRDEARRSRARLVPRGVRRILLVSDALHLLRARPLFEGEGFEVVVAPSNGPAEQRLDPERRLWVMRSLLSELAARLYARVL